MTIHAEGVKCQYVIVSTQSVGITSMHMSNDGLHFSALLFLCNHTNIINQNDNNVATCNIRNSLKNFKFHKHSACSRFQLSAITKHKTTAH